MCHEEKPGCCDRAWGWGWGFGWSEKPHPCLHFSTFHLYCYSHCTQRTCSFPCLLSRTVVDFLANWVLPTWEASHLRIYWCRVSTSKLFIELIGGNLDPGWLRDLPEVMPLEIYLSAFEPDLSDSRYSVLFPILQPSFNVLLKIPKAWHGLHHYHPYSPTSNVTSYSPLNLLQPTDLFAVLWAGHACFHLRILLCLFSLPIVLSTLVSLANPCATFMFPLKYHLLSKDCLVLSI